jgi:hypothetical protein
VDIGGETKKPKGMSFRENSTCVAYSFILKLKIRSCRWSSSEPSGLSGIFELGILLKNV